MHPSLLDVSDVLKNHTVMVLKNRVKRERWLAHYRDMGNVVLRMYFNSVTVQVCVLCIALLSCIIYIAETYTHQENPRIEVFFFTAFLFDYVMCYAQAQIKIDYVTSYMGIADLLSLLPLMSIFLGERLDNTAFATLN